MSIKEILKQAYLHKLLYRLDLLGDCFTNALNSNINKEEDFPTKQDFTHKHNDLNTHTESKPHSMRNAQQNIANDDSLQARILSNHSSFSIQTILQFQELHDLKTKVAHCSLCDLSKMVKEKERFCGFLPQKKLYIAPQQNNINSFEYSHQNAVKPLKIAFVVESLRLQQLGDSLHCLEQNKSNIMLQDIITKVMHFQKESVFIFPLFKCVSVGNDMSLSFKIQREELTYQRRVCRDYLLFQLEFVDYAIFFGKRLCQDFFGASLFETKGRILQYHTPRQQTIHAICVHDTLEMIANPTLKREAMLNFNLLKEHIATAFCLNNT